MSTKESYENYFLWHSVGVSFYSSDESIGGATIKLNTRLDYTALDSMVNRCCSAECVVGHWSLLFRKFNLFLFNFYLIVFAGIVVRVNFEGDETDDRLEGVLKRLAGVQVSR